MKFALFLIILTSRFCSILASSVDYKILESSFTKQHLSYLKNETKVLFDHGWDSYMKYGFPEDEVRPISCVPYTKDDDIFNIHRNDVLGNYSVTFLDTMTTFAIMGDIDRFTEYISIIKNIDFNVDSTVQVFETAIRALGSLLSAHLYASDKFKIPSYDGSLLRQAHDLGERLLPAYTHDMGIPLARVNLQNGVSKLPKKLIKDTCTAGAASPILEMTLLSVLTNDTRFETYSREAFFKLWGSRSKLNLIPMTIDPVKGAWLDAITGIGASIDSFYEYALKGAILFDDHELMNVWVESFKALSTHSRIEWFFGNVHVDTGLLVSPWIDALSAFFPGLLVLSGDIEAAIKSHTPFMKLWNQYQGIPERWDFLPSGPSNKLFGSGDNDPISLEWYLLRPEFIESTYYLYRATRDPIYLRIGEQILHDYINEFKAPCGFAGFRDVRTKKLQDRMESFVLSETLMYLYLLFDEGNDINFDGRAIFSTEGHPVWIPNGVLNQYKQHKIDLYNEQQRQLQLLLEKQQAEKDEILFDGIFNTTNFSRGFIHDLYESIKEWSHYKISNISILSDGNSVPNNFYDIDGKSKLGYIKPKKPEVCQTSTIRKDLFSNLINEPNAFLLDSKFHDQWKFKDSTIELSRSFYKIFGNPKAKCQREATSGSLEFLIGDRNEIPNIKVERIGRKAAGKVIQNDYFLSSILGLRLKLELLTLNSIDTFNRHIDSDFINRFPSDTVYDVQETCEIEDEILVNSVLRVNVVNGVPIDENSTIYIGRKSLKHLSSETLSVTRQGHIKIDNIVVLNMKTL